MSTPAVSRRFLLFLLLGALALFLYVASPFAKPILVAATFAAVLYPVQERLAVVFRGRRAPGAAILTAAVFAAVGGLLAYLGSTVVGQVVAGVRWLRDALTSEGVAGLVQRLPEPLRSSAARVTGDLPRLVERGRELLEEQGAAAVGGVLSATGLLVVQTLIMLVALYFLLAEGRRLVAWVEDVTPLEQHQVRELLAAFNNAIAAVVVSALATAGVQAVLAFVGYAAAGIPNPLFFAILTFVAALVPLVGSGIVILPVAGLYAATGHPLAGLLLAIWGVGVVGMVDNVLKPALMRRGLAVHVSLVFLSLLGGLATFGPIGFIAGPLTLAFFIATLRMWQRGEAVAAGLVRPSEPTGSQGASP